MDKNLPVLSKLILPSFLTLFKGVKIKAEGIAITESYADVDIDRESLIKYTDFIGLKTEFPLAFFYLMAQRAQTALMLNPKFTIAVPGMVHLSNKLEQISSINPSLPFDINTEVKVDYKETGSLIAMFKVDFSQKGDVVIRCESTYLAKRKSAGQKKPKKEVIEMIGNPQFEEIWDIPAGLGKKYGQSSGDKNPIHFSGLFAKIVGFKGAILHGWYSVSRASKMIEEKFSETYQCIEVEFLSPVFLPSQQKVIWKKNEDNKVSFQICDVQTGKLTMQGRLH